MTDSFPKIFEDIKADEQNADYTRQGIDPLYIVNQQARLVIIGQAPGRIAQETRQTWNDRSGDKLREWMGVDRETFYTSPCIAIMPMDFYFPGAGKSGDLPPRPGFAEKWHPRLLKLMPKIELSLLVGTYAVHAYLHQKNSVKLTDIIRDYDRYLPEFMPLAHPSWHNQLWLKKNPWYQEEVITLLQERIRGILNEE